MKVLMVITSHDQLGSTGRKTGFWLEELAAPYYVFKDAGVEITLASPKGGRPPLDPKSNEPASRTDLTRRFEKDAAAEAQLDKTVRLDSVSKKDYSTPFSTRAAMAECGISPRTSIHQTDRVLHCCRQANRHRVPFHRGAASRQDGGWQVSGSRQGSDRLRRRRGGGDGAHQSCALPCRR